MATVDDHCRLLLLQRDVSMTFWRHYGRRVKLNHRCLYLKGTWLREILSRQAGNIVNTSLPSARWPNAKGIDLIIKFITSPFLPIGNRPPSRKCGVWCQSGPFRVVGAGRSDFKQRVP
jgi:hypothetical protein